MKNLGYVRDFETRKSGGAYVLPAPIRWAPLDMIMIWLFLCIRIVNTITVTKFSISFSELFDVGQNGPLFEGNILALDGFCGQY